MLPCTGWMVVYSLKGLKNWARMNVSVKMAMVRCSSAQKVK